MNNAHESIQRIIKVLGDAGYANPIRFRLINSLNGAEVEYHFNHDFAIPQRTRILQFFYKACEDEGYTKFLERDIPFN